MAKSECKCLHFSCEPLTEKIDGVYQKSPSMRFMFVKDDDGVITNEIVVGRKHYYGGVAEGTIDDCPIKKNLLEDKKDFVKEKNNYCDKGGHKERSEHHSPNHKRHWSKSRHR